MWDDVDIPPRDLNYEEEELGEDIEEEASSSDASSEDERADEMHQTNIVNWRGQSKLPQEILSDEEPLPQSEVFSSPDEEEEPKPTKPPKKFFENPTFYTRKNRPELPPEMWDEEENMDNIETLMKQPADKNELDAAVLEGVMNHIRPNFGFDDVTNRDAPRPPSSVDSNFDIVLSSSDEEKIPKIEVDHYKELILADDQLIDCTKKRKPCTMMEPTKYYGLAKILERKEKIRNQKALAGTKSTLSSYMTVLNSSCEAASYCPSSTARRKGWKLKEPFPKRDSIENNISSSSTMEFGSESDRKLLDESQPGPQKLLPKCRWFDECLFKLLFKLAVKREKKNSTIKATLDIDIDEILDDLFIMGKDAKNHLSKLTDDFRNYKNDFARKFDQNRKEKKDDGDEEIKMWPDPLPKGQLDMEINEMFLGSGQKPGTTVQSVSARLYTKKPYKDSPRAAVDTRIAAERALDVKKRMNIIEKKFKTIEINLEALPQAMQAYYKEKEDLKKKREKEVGKPKDDDHTKRKHANKEKRIRELRARSTSIHPSYTRLIPPYSNVCRERIRKTLKNYRKAFADELQSLADQQTFALAGVALKRMYVITMGKGDSPVKFTQQEQARLHQVLEK